jgi:hypothetical protein
MLNVPPELSVCARLNRITLRSDEFQEISFDEDGCVCTRITGRWKGHVERITRHRNLLV